jgi:hypothetical protein
MEAAAIRLATPAVRFAPKMPMATIHYDHALT